MADSPTDKFEKTVLLKLEATLKGIQGALDALRDIESLSRKASKSTDSFSKAEDSLTKSIKTATKHTAKYTKALGGVRKLQKGLYETTRAIGGITRTAFTVAGAAAAAYLVETKRIGQTMLDVQTSSMGAAGALTRLGKAYSGFGSSAGSAVLSLQDVATSLAKFRSQGIAQMATGLNQSFNEGFMGIQDTMTKVMGKGGAATLLESFYKSMGSEFLTFRKSMAGELRDLTQDFAKARQAGDKGASITALTKLSEHVKGLRLHTSDVGVAATQVANQFDILSSALKGKNPTVRGIIAINEALALVGTIAEDVSVKLLETFGNDVGELVDAFKDKIRSATGPLEELIDYIKKVRKKFEDWGGVKTLIEKMNSAIDKAWKLLKSAGKAAAEFISWFAGGGGATIVKYMKYIVDAAASLADWFIKLSNEGKLLAAVVAGIALSPGLSVGLISLVSVFKDVAMWATRSATATRALNAAALAAGGVPGAGVGLGTKVAGVASGVAVGGALAVGGHFGGKAIAEAAGAEKHGVGSALAGAGLAALGGAVGGAQIGTMIAPGIGTAIGAGIGALTMSIGSLTGSIIQRMGYDKAQSKEQEKATEALSAQNKKMTEQLKASAESMNKFAVSDLQKARAEEARMAVERSEITGKKIRGEMTEIDATKEMAKLDKKLNELVGKRRELGGFDKIALAKVEAEYQTRVDQQTKLMNKAMAGIKQSKDPAAASQEQERYEDLIRRLKEAGRWETVLKNIAAERIQIQSQQGAPGVDDDKIRAGMKDADARSKYAKDQQIKLGVDSESPIASVKKLFEDLQTMQENMKVGVKVDFEGYEKSKSAAMKAYDDLRDNLTNIEGGQFDATIKSLDDMRNAINSFTNDAFARFLSSLADLSEFERTIPGFTESLSGLVSVLGTLGPAAQVFGDSLGSITKEVSGRGMEEAFLAMEKSAVAVKIALSEIEKAKASGAGQDKIQEKTRRWQIEFAKGIKISDQAVKLMGQSLEGMLEPLKKQLDLTTALKDLRKLDLDISQQLYGTPALAVQAQLAVVQAQQKEKEILEDQLAVVRREHDLAKARMGSSKDIFLFKMKELDLAKKIKQTTADQLRQVKELRDGYLDAVKAQALGAGRFSKIIITQEQNMMRGLQKGAQKRNYLLGQYGEDAAKMSAQSFRFTDQMGVMRTSSGQTVDNDVVRQEMASRAAGMRPDAAAATMFATDLVLENSRKNSDLIVQGASKNTDRLIGALDPINRYANTMTTAGAAGAALRGGGVPAGETAFGEMARQVMRGGSGINKDTGFGGLDPGTLDDFRKYAEESGMTLQEVMKLRNVVLTKAQQPPQFNPDEYRKYAESRGSASGPINAYIEYMKKQGEALDPKSKEAAAGVKPDITASNFFYRNAIHVLEHIARAVDPKGKFKDGLADKVVNSLGSLLGNWIGSGFGKAAGANAEMGYLGFKPGTKLSLDQSAEPSPADRSLINNLRKSDRQVKRHERAHAAAGGKYVQGRPEYSYKRGPDGKRYAVGGRVLIDVSPISGDPEGTIEKMQQIRKAALAPRHPSEQDLKVAQTATRIEDKMRQVLKGKQEQQLQMSTGVPAIWLPSTSPSKEDISQDVSSSGKSKQVSRHVPQFFKQLISTIDTLRLKQSFENYELSLERGAEGQKNIAVMLEFFTMTLGSYGAAVRDYTDSVKKAKVLKSLPQDQKTQTDLGRNKHEAWQANWDVGRDLMKASEGVQKLLGDTSVEAVIDMSSASKAAKLLGDVFDAPKSAPESRPQDYRSTQKNATTQEQEASAAENAYEKIHLSRIDAEKKFFAAQNKLRKHLQTDVTRSPLPKDIAAAFKYDTRTQKLKEEEERTGERFRSFYIPGEEAAAKGKITDAENTIKSDDDLLAQIKQIRADFKTEIAKIPQPQQSAVSGVWDSAAQTDYRNLVETAQSRRDEKITAVQEKQDGSKEELKKLNTNLAQMQSTQYSGSSLLEQKAFSYKAREGSEASKAGVESEKSRLKGQYAIIDAIRHGQKIDWGALPTGLFDKAFSQIEGGSNDTILRALTYAPKDIQTESFMGQLEKFSDRLIHLQEEQKVQPDTARGRNRAREYDLFVDDTVSNLEQYLKDVEKYWGKDALQGQFSTSPSTVGDAIDNIQAYLNSVVESDPEAKASPFKPKTPVLPPLTPLDKTKFLTEAPPKPEPAPLPPEIKEIFDLFRSKSEQIVPTAIPNISAQPPIDVPVPKPPKDVPVITPPAIKTPILPPPSTSMVEELTGSPASLSQVPDLPQVDSKPAVDLSKSAEEYSSAAAELRDVLGAGKNYELLNRKELEIAYDKAEGIVAAHEKRYNILKKTAPLTAIQNIDLESANQTLDAINRAKVAGSKKYLDLEQNKKNLLEQEANLQKQITANKPLVAEVAKIEELEQKRARTGAMTKGYFKEQMKDTAKIADLYRKSSGLDRSVAPEERAAYGAELEGKFGKNAESIGRAANQTERYFTGTGTHTEGAGTRSGERMMQSLSSLQQDLKSTQTQKGKTQSKLDYLDLPSQGKAMKPLATMFGQILNDGIKGFQTALGPVTGGGLTGVIPAITQGFESHTASKAEKKRDDIRKEKATSSLESMMNVVRRGGVYAQGIAQRPTSAKELENVPQLSAFDNRRERIRTPKEEAVRRFGPKGVPISRELEKLKVMEDKLAELKKKAKGKGKAPQIYGVGAKDLHGFELATDVASGATPAKKLKEQRERALTPKQRQKQEKRRKKLAAIRNAQRAKIEKMMREISADEHGQRPGSKRSEMTDSTFMRREAEKAVLQRNATNVAGLTYSPGSIPERIKGTNIGTGTITAGVESPGRIRTLGGKRTGGGSPGKGAAAALRESARQNIVAAESIEQMENAGNHELGNITDTGRGRSSFVQPAQSS